MKEKLSEFRSKYKRYEPLVFFTIGFLFDVFTLRRIDDWLKLGFQVAFILLLGWFLVLQHRENKGKPRPAALAKIWPYQIEIVHFLFGSLLSAFVIFYFKSASATRSVVFLVLLVILMVLNELKSVRERGVRLRVTLFGFCLASFLIYFLPVIAGHMGVLLFVAAIILSLAGSAVLLSFIAREEPEAERRRTLRQFGWPILAIHAVLLTAYFLKVIPPVPLSMTFGGIYHKVEKDQGHVRLYSLKPWYNFWSRGENVFLSRAGEPLFCFVRVFAPTEFTEKVFLHWMLYDERQREYLTQDRIGINVIGGREEGFRGFAYKANYAAGFWRVDLETEDGRTIGTIKFSVVNDTSTNDRVWMIDEG